MSISSAALNPEDAGWRTIASPEDLAPREAPDNPLLRDFERFRPMVDDLNRRFPIGQDTDDRLLSRVVDHIVRSDLASQALAEKLAPIILDEGVGFGPIGPLLRDPRVSEVMVNRPREVYVEMNGMLYLTDRYFRDAEHIATIAGRLVRAGNREVSLENPLVDARLADGTRINITIPPVSVDSPLITIRKFVRDRMSATDLVDRRFLTEDALLFLRAVVAARLSILISGGTSSGKTTFLNALSSFISPGERVVTIEDVAELQLRQRHVIRLETNLGENYQRQISARDLVRNALRMRPDRIVLGEVRGDEAIELLQAMNTGHEGSLTTIHANSPRDALTRLETLAYMGGLNVPANALREMITRSINLIVQTARIGGFRQIVAIHEVAAYRRVGFETIPLFETTIGDESGTARDLLRTGEESAFTRRLILAGWPG